MPETQLLLVVDDSPISREAERLLEEKGIQFLVAKPDGLVVTTLPILLVDENQVVGIDNIRRFAREHRPKSDTRRIVRTLRILRKMGVTADLSSFNNRLKLQKIVYLLEELGLPIDWGFNWYIRGPYSPSLAHELFDHRNLRLSREPPSEADVEVIEKFRRIFDVRKATPLELEAAAAVRFVATENEGKYRTASELAEQVRQKKKFIPFRLVKTYVKMFYPDLAD